MAKEKEANKDAEAVKDMGRSEAVEARHKRFLDVMKTVDKNNREKGMDEPLISTIDGLSAVEVERFSSGSLVLDSITGGGFPRRRIIEIYGPESSGKTSIALNAIANVQREGGNAVFVDAEQALDTRYAQTLGVDLERLGIAQISIAETALQVCAELAKSGEVDLIVVDSVASLSPKAEAEGDLEKAQVAILARLMSKALRVLVPACAKNDCTIIFLNQIREKVGIVFGNPETTPGGKALKFYASQRIEIRRKGQEKEGDKVIGTTVRMKVVKNKVAPPFKEGLTVLTFAHGINRPAEMLVVGEEMGIIEPVKRSFFYTPKKDIKLVGDISSMEDGRIKIASSKGAAVEALGIETELYNAIAEEVQARIAAQREGVELSHPNAKK